MQKLQIFITDDCWFCEESRRIAEETQAYFKEVEVTLVDLHSPERPPSVFATPTYLLNGQVIFLGNPRREELWAQLVQTNVSSGEGGVS
jgi:hypothetical protein